MLKNRIILSFLLSILCLALLTQPLSAKTTMECPNGVPCTSMSGGGILPCCHHSQNGHQTSGCIIRGSARIDYISQHGIVTIDHWTPALIVHAILILPPAIPERCAVADTVIRPPWEFMVSQGLGARAPPSLLTA